VFPVEVDIDHPVFRACLDRLLQLSLASDQAVARGGVVGTLQRGWYAAKAFLTFGRLYLVPVKEQALPPKIRMDPVW
jgi:magnesium-protoporphyrin IX monomethyl ester (oxidative) cyclase